MSKKFKEGLGAAITEKDVENAYRQERGERIRK